MSYLEGVSQRLQNTSPDKMEGVVANLLPRMIQILSSQREKSVIKAKENLAAIRSIIDARQDMQLPLNTLVTLYNSSRSDATVRSVANEYVQMAYRRAPTQKRHEVNASVLGMRSRQPPEHQGHLERLTISGLEPQPSYEYMHNPKVGRGNSMWEESTVADDYRSTLLHPAYLPDRCAAFPDWDLPGQALPAPHMPLVHWAAGHLSTSLYMPLALVWAPSVV
ncbi:hypothetical protein CYMTET_45989 [Cymbomonas tetramitiformis]|uniref:Proteasome component Ecm29 N-terminal domain-containing protein n=1 Tax=Cymbomonas tetramitiformis TaxID=36881 RepID=A0AAE0BYC8_9CHLO|nr:hypothetical protein CYMTET_45989 [Cymbomonas tetramitiformis]